MIRAWAAKKLIGHTIGALNRGDPTSQLRMEAPDVHFSFPGSSEWAIEARSRDEVRQWLEGMVAAGIQHQVDEVVVGGPPWRMTMALRGRDHADAADGTRVYENRYVIWGVTRWGRITEYEVYEDTEKATAFASWLQTNEVRRVPAG